jgi:YgiT-type zinc finger domain-containing protein
MNCVPSKRGETSPGLVTVTLKRGQTTVTLQRGEATVTLQRGEATVTLQRGEATVTLQRGETSVIVKQVPAEVCETCGEYYLAKDVTALVTEKAEGAVRSGAEVQILKFAA